MPALNTTDLIAQIQTIAGDYEANAADAEKWRDLVNHCAKRGYGPNITPAQIVGFIPDAAFIAEVVSASADRKRASRKGIPLGPRGPRPASGNGTAGPGQGEESDDD